MKIAPFILIAAASFLLLQPVAAVVPDGAEADVILGRQLPTASNMVSPYVAVDPATLKTIREVISSNADGASEAHDIRTRQAGRTIFIDFHLVVPGTMSVEASHEICDRIEARLRDAVANAQITIHVEPEQKAKHSGIVVV